MTIKSIPIKDLKLAEYNPRIITKEEFEGLKKSLQTFGLVENIVVNKDMTVIGGHQRIRAWKELDNTTIPCYVVDLDKHEEKKLNVILNSQAISGKYDDTLLSEILEELKLDEDYFDLRLDKLEPLDLSEPEQIEEDAGPGELPPIPKTVLGDLYELNGHRLLCGSATSMDDYTRLMNGMFFDLVITDPPYNVDYTGKTKNALKIDNDKMTNDGFYQFLLDFYITANSFMKEGSSIYVFHADVEGHNFRQAFLDAQFKLSQCLVWKKNSLVMGRNDYHWKHEPILYGWKEGSAHQGFSDRTQTTVLEFDRPSRNDVHPTMKPINILAYLISNNSKGRDLIGDMFLGSGSTLIASEQINRVCYGTELDPKYCDVIVKRWVKYMQDKDKDFTVKLNGVEIDVEEYFKEEQKEKING